jgi:hypothetical protein
LRLAQVSGKTWKAPAQRASTVMKAGVSKSWKQRMADKASRKQLTEQKQEAKAEAKAKRKVGPRAEPGSMQAQQQPTSY